MMNDMIFIEELSVAASIGVFEWEKRITQTLHFDVELSVDLTTAGQSDDMKDTVCYAKVSETIIAVTQRQHHDLLESLANHIFTELFKTSSIHTISLKISKPGAVKAARNVGIKMIRTR